jgi:hypothetical protein
LEFFENLNDSSTSSVSIIDITQSIRAWFASPPTIAQDTKDFGRDSVRLNAGEVLRGAEIGFDGILAQLESLVGDADVARSVLSVAGRTFSGGITFESVIARFSETLCMSAPTPGSELIKRSSTDTV